jgi:hypothetical protein
LTETLTDKEKITKPKLSSPLVIQGEGEEDFLARAYLSELRDRKYAAMGSPTISQESKIKVKLEPADIAEFPFRDYLRQLGPLLKNPGALSVISKPRGALITIDDSPHGSTNRDFVVSRGKHSVSVKSPKLSCAGNVNVESELVIFRCPT